MSALPFPSIDRFRINGRTCSRTAETKRARRAGTRTPRRAPHTPAHPRTGGRTPRAAAPRRQIGVVDEREHDLVRQRSRTRGLSQVDDAAVHAAGEIIARLAEHDHHPAGHVLAEEASRIPPDHHHGTLLAVLLHVDASAPTAAVADEDAPAAHGIARRIAASPADDHLAGVHRVAHLVLGVAEHAHGIARRITASPADDHLAGVHRVAHLVLGVAEHLDDAAVHVARQIVARSSVNAQSLALGQRAAQITLGAYIVELDVVGLLKHPPDLLVGLLEVKGAERQASRGRRSRARRGRTRGVRLARIAACIGCRARVPARLRIIRLHASPPVSRALGR